MKSAINEAKLTKRYNTGDYEFEEYSLGAIVDDRETGVQVLKELKLQINEAFSGSAAVQEEQIETKSSKKADKKEEKKNGKPSKGSDAKDDSNDDEDSSDEDSSSDDKGSEDDEASDSKNDDDSDDSSNDGITSSDAEEEEPKPKSKAEKSGKKFKKKAQTYNRGIEQHKEIFSKLLGSINPSWKQSDKTKALAKSASSDMEGKEFLDENGEVVATFKVAVSKIFKPKK